MPSPAPRAVSGAASEPVPVEPVPLEIIKVCGITNPEDAVFAATHGATAIGMIFYPGSPRCVSVPQAARISAALPPGVSRVGVFVNQSPEMILKIAAEARLDIAQLHGDEPPALLAALGKLRTWKVFRVGAEFDASAAARYHCEALFLDTATETAYGGSGETFAWEKALEVKQHGRVILAGGLDGSNVGGAIALVSPYGVDASSRLESQPGRKDHAKVRAYLDAARGFKKS